jgi:hypothetical protein
VDVGAPSGQHEEKFGVILEPGGRVKLDALIETIAAFRDQDARTARRAIRRGKGLLALDLTRSDSLVLESALTADKQPVRIVKLDPALDYEPPRATLRVECRRNGFWIYYVDGGKARFGFEEIRLLSAGLMAPSPGKEEDEPSGLVCDIFGFHRSQAWRICEPLSPEDARAGQLDDSAKKFIGLLGELNAQASRAAKTPIFEKLASGRVEPKMAFPDLENLDNYQRWMLLAKFAAPA